MKRYSENGLTLLKDFKVKETTETLKNDIYAINNVIYKHMYRYILPNTTNRLLNLLTDYGKKIKAYDYKKDILKKKQQEVLAQLRKLIVSLRMISMQKYSKEELEFASNNIQKFQVSSYLKKKDKMIYEDAMVLLQENLDIFNDLPDKKYLIPTFQKMQDELLKIVEDKYKFS